MNKRLTLVFLTLFAGCVMGSAAAQTQFGRDPAKLHLASVNAVVVDANAKQSVYAKGADDVTPIASLTKLMTAMVTLDAKLPDDEVISIGVEDLDFLKGTKSRLRLGAELPRHEMLRPRAHVVRESRGVESRAHLPGGTRAFVAAMNAKSRGARDDAHRLRRSRQGLSAQNVSTANDLAILGRRGRRVSADPRFQHHRQPLSSEVQPTGQILGFNNTNNLVKNDKWDIKLSKTGYIREAGKCLVMLATIASKPFVIVLLDSAGKYTRLGDAQRVPPLDRNG
jgi:D-alanyl-D-alanine endopeptidase (penicillin-binding protein 7)